MPYILILAGWYPSKVDVYSGDFVQRHAQAIAQHHNVVVLFATKCTNVRKLTITETQITATLKEIIVYYPAHNYIAKLGALYYYYQAIRQVYTRLVSVQGKPSIVHCMVAYRAGLWARYLQVVHKLPYFITDHSSMYTLADPNYVGKHYFQKKLLQNIFEHAQAIISISHQYIHNLGKLYRLPKAQYIVPNVVDTSLFYYQPRLGNEVYKYIHVSTMDYAKHVAGILTAYSKLTKLIPNVELTLVGPVTENVTMLIQQLNIQQHITLTGLVPYTQVAAYMQASDALILNSRYEGLPCVLLEAWCCGVPVIATDVGAISEVLHSGNGILIPSDEDSTALYHAMVLMYNTYTYNNKAIATDAAMAYSYDAVGTLFSRIYAPYITG